ncbi:GntR family transcriptional regulator [Microbacterium sp. No. 7]|uniref:GntR family transcriptional regulator n=1 Tax=Microbacterium sp. No. 7 TaxID=1714373 RepID=UPI0006D2AFBA|nr:GntR family transcriptional regulator [Microbacterium sp. No. 7]ALJ19258.1 hypothetical protein AOA12_04810 [Microbacterium sp. No. 7]
MKTAPRTPAPARLPARASLPNEVASYIRELILSGTLRPGENVRLETVAEAQQVSLTPVREAVNILERDGLVTAVPRRGFVVTAISRKDVIDLFWAEGRLAGELAARAAVLIDDEGLERLEAAMRACDDAVARGDAEACGAHGTRFHQIINRAAQSDRLARLLGRIVSQLPDHFYVSIQANVQTAPSQHHDLFRAIADSDPERARHAAEVHMRSHADNVVDLLEQRGLWDDAPA